MKSQWTNPLHRTARPSRRAARLVVHAKSRAVLLLIAALSLAPASAHAIDYHLRFEPGVAFPLTTPQSQVFHLGGAGALKVGIGFWDILDIELAGHFVGLSASETAPSNDFGTVWGGGAGLRLHYPHRSFVSPWIDADVLYVRTGPLDRLGFSVGAGLGFALNAKHSWWLGPFVRYLQVVQPDHVGTQNDDAKILIAGLSLEFGSAGRRAPPVSDIDLDGIPDAEDACPQVAGPRSNDPLKNGCPPPPPPGDRDHDGVTDDKDVCPDDAKGAHPDPAKLGCPLRDRDGDGVFDVDDRCPDQPGSIDNKGCPDRDHDGLVDLDDRCPDAAGPKETAGCPDRDHDGVVDRDDYCPDVVGPVDNHGCPKYRTVTLTLTKLEITEKIYFANDSAKILPKSFPVLDDVTKALTDARDLRVRIEGHTDSNGKAEHNQVLSEQRAKSVMDYLVKKGINAGRLKSAGYGSTQELDTNNSVNGREHNRRVEFVILNDGSAK